MPSRIFHYLLISIFLLCGGVLGRAGVLPYTDPGKIDFDTALQVLNHYGTWSKIEGAWAYTPLDHLAPYTSGRWIYTEYGWCWKSNRATGWVTEHYGFWKKSSDKVWSWYPGPYWLPEIVEIRTTSTHIGWHSAAVDRDGNFIEKPADRFARTDEWTFVTLAQFAGPITPGIAAPPDVAKQLLEESTECRHTYLTYRVIDRPGPHPADFLALGDGGMLAPKMPAIEAPLSPTSISGVTQPAAVRGTTAGTPAPMGNVDPDVDKRQVKYWITRSLPSLWAKPAADAKPEEVYIYRPDFFQDEDGIARRITLWFNPQARSTLKEVLGEKLPGAQSGTAPATSTPAAPASNDPFRIPLDDYHPGPAPKKPNASTKQSSPPAGSEQYASPTNAVPVNSR